MAKAKNEVAVTESKLPATILFDEDDVGAGLEGAGQDSFALPILAVLQKGSPQVDEASGVSLEGAKAGMFFDNVSGKLRDGKSGVRLVQAAYRRVFLRWGPRGSDSAGFKGELAPDQVAQLRAEGKIVEHENRLYFPLPDGTISEKKCDRVADTRLHYVLVLDEDGSWSNAVLSLTSTQIKKSKLLMSALAAIKKRTSDGRFITPPTFATVIRATTVPEQNDEGTWFGVRFEVAGDVESPEVYAAAKQFYQGVSQGQNQARFDDPGTKENPVVDEKF